MLSKLEAAKIANSAGVHLAIISGHKDHPLSAFAQTGQGTVFHSAGSQGARKKWLAGRLTVKGHISVDAGAAKALAVMWPEVSKEIGATKEDYALLVTIFMIFYAFGQSPFGRIFDAIGTRMG